jgi:hypothetical protein
MPSSCSIVLHLWNLVWAGLSYFLPNHFLYLALIALTDAKLINTKYRAFVVLSYVPCGCLLLVEYKSRENWYPKMLLACADQTQHSAGKSLSFRKCLLQLIWCECRHNIAWVAQFWLVGINPRVHHCICFAMPQCSCSLILTGQQCCNVSPTRYRRTFRYVLISRTCYHTLSTLQLLSVNCVKTLLNILLWNTVVCSLLSWGHWSC